MEYLYYHSGEMPGFERKILRMQVMEWFSLEGLQAVLGHFGVTGAAMTLHAVVATSGAKEFSLSDLREGVINVLPAYIFDGQIYPQNQEQLANSGLIDKGLLALDRRTLEDIYSAR